MGVVTVSYNGSGTFQINTSGQPVVAGTVISSTAFNALTADLATGLSTAITKDGQTTTTARIPFAQGISSTLTTDSSSVSTGSIITAGGVGIAKALYVGTNVNVAGTTNLAGLTASSAVATDASKNLVSVTNTGTGNNVLATSPTLVTPVLGAATATSVNKLTLTAPATSATLTVADGATLATAGAFSLTLTATAATNVTLPTTGTLLSTADVATQAEQETATSTTTLVTPGRQQFHPSAAKAWIQCNNNGAIAGSYNVASIADTGTGVVTVTLTTAFSSTNYCVLGTGNGGGGGLFNGANITSASVFTLLAFNSLTQTAQDSGVYFGAAFGDQ